MTPIDNHDSHRTHARLSRLIASIKGGVLVEDETRHIALVNQTFCDMFSIPASPDSLIGTDCSGSADASKGLFVNPEAFVARIDTILQERQVVNGEMLFLTDGRVFCRDYAPIFSDNAYIGHLWHYHDTTESYQAQRRAERLLKFEKINREINRLFLQLDSVDMAMRESLAMTGELLDVSRVYVFRFRENERLLDNTHEWCAPGVKPEIENLQGMPFDDIFPSIFPMLTQHDLIAPHHISELPEDLRGVLEPQDIQSVLWVPLYLNDRIEGFIGYDETRQPRDWLPEEITMVRIIAEAYARALERDRANRMLVEARDEAIRMARLRAQFVANMSHEIRTPMTGTLGMLELVLETPLDELQHEFALEAYKSAAHLLHIINDILDFSKLEAGQVTLESDPIDLKAIVTEVKMTLLPQLKDKPVEFRTEIDANLPYRVYGDATRLRQVLMNLAGNAVKFTHQGHVTVSIHLVRTLENMAYLRFAVQDTGIGIAPENHTRIFESFVQADGSTTRRYGGSGLGLSIVRQLLGLMDSTITLESTPGEGSTFSFLVALPIAQAAGTEKTQHTAFTHLRTAVVDSNRTARYVLGQLLETWGVSVVLLHDLAELEDQPDKRDLAFDMLFHRYYPGMNLNALHSAITQRAEHIVYIVDQPSLKPYDSALVLTWPVEQSSLYNLLMHTVQNRLPRLADVPPIDPLVVSGRVLLVDDYPNNLDLVRHALADLQIETDIVENGQQALMQLQKAPYDLILMDMQMPVMDGMEATRRIRQSEAAYHTLPVIALTASVMREQQERYMAAGVNEIIGKPFSVRHLREVVLRWLTQPTDAGSM
ncbi:MAG: hypothetical protein OHK0046_00570 [Anaerolineae bacterium]